MITVIHIYCLQITGIPTVHKLYMYTTSVGINAIKTEFTVRKLICLKIKQLKCTSLIVL